MDSSAGDQGAAGAISKTGEIPLQAPASLLVTAGADVYSLEVHGRSSTRVQRVSVTQRRVASSQSLAGTPVAASVFGRLAVATSLGRGGGSTTGHSVLTVLDPTSLRVLRARTFTNINSVVARPEGIYTAIPGKLLLLDPNTLTIVKTLTVDADLQRAVGAELGADPRSNIMYLGVPCACKGRPVVDVVDLHRWAVIARTHVDAVVAAVPQGVGTTPGSPTPPA